MAEILDIVDEQGRPTGQTVPRAVAHAEGIRHRTSHVWILRRLQLLRATRQSCHCRIQ